jgi:cob(I)alamin adenosyltransferase
MSRRQEKMAQRLAEQQEFLAARRTIQLAMFEQSLEVGLKVYEDNKDRLSPEDIEKIEAQLEENRRLIAKLRSEIDPATQA